MIDTNNAGGALSAAWKNRLAATGITTNEAPVFTLLMYRKTGATYDTRDITKLWLSMNPIDIELQRQFGVTSITPIDFRFDNSPLTFLSANYVSGTTLTVKPRRERFVLAVNDWISISDSNNTEYKRVTAVGHTGGALTSITIHSALSNTYNADETAIRFLFTVKPGGTSITVLDLFRGGLKLKQEWADITEEVVWFQGDIVRGYVSADNNVIMECEYNYRKLERNRLPDDIEFDTRGVVSRPAPDPTNTGNGEASKIVYHPNKLPDVITTETYTATFDATATNEDGLVVGAWDFSGSVTGAIASGNVPPNRDGEDGWLPVGDATGERTWTIDLLEGGDFVGTEALGFAFQIVEGETAFANLDAFKCFAQAPTAFAVVEGRDFTTNPIKAIGDLKPSYIVEYLIKSSALLDHDNPETDVTTDMLPAAHLTTIRTYTHDNITLRGILNADMTYTEAIAAVLTLSQGYVFPTGDGHLRIFYADEDRLNDTADGTIQTAHENTPIVQNALTVTSRQRGLDERFNVIELTHNDGDIPYEHMNENTASTTEWRELNARFRGTAHPSQVAFITRRKFSNVEAQRLNIPFWLDSWTTLSTLTDNMIDRFKDPIYLFDANVNPEFLLYETGDIVILNARELDFNGRTWVYRVRKDIKPDRPTIETTLFLEENLY